MKIVAGRAFSRDYPTDKREAFIVNETAVREYKWGTPEQALGKTINREGKIGKVIGVVQDFNFMSLTNAISAISVVGAILIISSDEATNLSKVLGFIAITVVDYRTLVRLAWIGLGGAVVMPISGAVLGMGVDALILAFVVVVIGGLGSLEGALVGALIVGFVRTIGITYFAEVELAVLYLIAAVVLFVRPAGLFGRA